MQRLHARLCRSSSHLAPLRRRRRRGAAAGSLRAHLAALASLATTCATLVLPTGTVLPTLALATLLTTAPNSQTVPTLPTTTLSKESEIGMTGAT